MKRQKTILILFLTFCAHQINAQDSQDNDYIEFNDRKNILHGVYLGLDVGYGQIDGGNKIFLQVPK